MVCHHCLARQGVLGGYVLSSRSVKDERMSSLVYRGATHGGVVRWMSGKHDVKVWGATGNLGGVRDQEFGIAYRLLFRRQYFSFGGELNSFLQLRKNGHYNNNPNYHLWTGSVGPVVKGQYAFDRGWELSTAVYSPLLSLRGVDVQTVLRTPVGIWIGWQWQYYRLKDVYVVKWVTNQVSLNYYYRL